MNAVIYARFSSHAQNEQSIEGQLAECYAFAKKNGYVIIDEYIDRALTGKSDHRPAFQRMIADSAKKTFQYVIVYQLDRFSRNRTHSALYKMALQKNNVRVISARENITDDASGILIEGVLESIAEYYSAELSQKVRRGMNLNAEKGLSNGGSIPLGFYVDSEKRYQIDPKTSALVKEIFECYANGEPAIQICNSLNNRGFRSSRGSKFNKNSLHSILRNKKYIGIYCYNGIEKANAIPRIIDDALFARVQERLASNKAAPSRTRALEEFLLTTKLFCGHCRAMMVGVSGTSRTGAKHHYYSCNTARLTRNCQKKNVKKALIEDSVIKAAAKQLTPENIDLIVKEVLAVCEEAQRNSEVQRLKTELKKLDKQKSNLMSALKMDGADNVVTEMIFSEMRELAASQENLKIQLAKETSKILTVSETEVRFFLSRLSSGNISEKRYKKALINIFINRIYLYDDGRVDIYFNTQETPFTVDISNIDFNEASQIEGSCAKQNGSPYERGSTFGTDFLDCPKSRPLFYPQSLAIQVFFCDRLLVKIWTLKFKQLKMATEAAENLESEPLFPETGLLLLS